jgi:hypothetical protein
MRGTIANLKSTTSTPTPPDLPPPSTIQRPSLEPPSPTESQSRKDRLLSGFLFSLFRSPVFTDLRFVANEQGLLSGEPLLLPTLDSNIRLEANLTL